MNEEIREILEDISIYADKAVEYERKSNEIFFQGGPKDLSHSYNRLRTECIEEMRALANKLYFGNLASEEKIRRAMGRFSYMLGWIPKR